MSFFRTFMCIFAMAFVSACATLPQPGDVKVPTPLLNNSGAFMSPYTQDGVVAPWVDKAVSVKLGTTIGSTAGALIGQQIMGQIPIVGGILGEKLGRETARMIALEAIGGEEYIKSTSDMSFNSVPDLIVYVYAMHSTHPSYQDVFSAVSDIYPDMKQQYMSAIMAAAKK